MFSTRLDNLLPFLSKFKLSSANSFSLEESKIFCPVMCEGKYKKCYYEKAASGGQNTNPLPNKSKYFKESVFKHYVKRRKLMVTNTFCFFLSVLNLS